MAGASVSVSAPDLNKIDLMVARLKNPDFENLLESIGSMVETQTDVRLKTSKAAPDGTSWPALSPNYAKHKKTDGGILQLEGDLRKSIVSLVTGNSSVEVGTNVDYAATHQYGDPKRGIPQREFLGLSPENEEEINTLIKVWWQGLVGSAV